MSTWTSPRVTMHQLFTAQTDDRHRVLHGRVPPPTKPIGTLKEGDRLRRFFITTTDEIKEYSIPIYFEVTRIYHVEGVPHARIDARYNPPLNVFMEMPLHRIPQEFTK